jgi:hypothetical protein
MTMSPTNVAYMWASEYFFTMENVVRVSTRCINQSESDKQTRTVGICIRYEIELRAPMQSNERRVVSTVITRNKQLLRLTWPSIIAIG